MSSEGASDTSDASRAGGTTSVPLDEMIHYAPSVPVPDAGTISGDSFPSGNPAPDTVSTAPLPAPKSAGQLLNRPACGIAVRQSARGGRGVFAERRFAKGDVIEHCPVLFIPANQVPHIYETDLVNYVYPWVDEVEDAVMVLGFGSLYNHSYAPNADWIQDFQQMVHSYVALRDIKEGEEITVNYNGPPDDPAPLWFEVTD